MPVRVISGDETGLIKLTDVAAQSYASYGDQSRSRGIQGLAWTLHSGTSAGATTSKDGNNSDSSVCDVFTNVFTAMRIDGALEYWHHDVSQDTLSELSLLTVNTGFQNPQGCVSLYGSASHSGGAARTMAYDANGDCIVVKYDPTGSSSSGNGGGDDDDGRAGGKRKRKGSTKSSSSSSNGSSSSSSNNPMSKLSASEIVHTYDRGVEGKTEVVTAFNVQGPLICAVGLQDSFVVAGKENDLKVYDVETQEPLWKAKNVPHDNLALRVPVWVTDMKLRSPRSCSGSGAQIVAGTSYKHIRVYDTKAKRQPVLNFETACEYRISSVQPTADGNYVYVGDASGSLLKYDLRTGQRVGTVKGSIGSIRSQYLASNDQLAIGGLDRYVRLHDTEKVNGKGKGYGNTYLKNRINSVLATHGGADGYVPYTTTAADAAAAAAAALVARRKAIGADDDYGSDDDDSADGLGEAGKGGGGSDSSSGAEEEEDALEQADFSSESEAEGEGEGEDELR